MSKTLGHAYVQSIKIGGVIWSSMDEDVDEEIIIELAPSNLTSQSIIPPIVLLMLKHKMYL